MTRKIEDYMHIVESVAKHVGRKLPPNIEHEDLVQVGAIGLMGAIENYKEVSGATFDTYAKLRIRGEIMDEMRNLDFISRSSRKKSRDIDAAIFTLEGRLKRRPTTLEVAMHMGVSVEAYHQMLFESGTSNPIAFEDITEGEWDWLERNHGDHDGPLEMLLRKERVEHAVNVMDALPAQHKEAVSLYYFRDVKLKTAGEMVGLTESRVCQVTNKLRQDLHEAATLP